MTPISELNMTPLMDLTFILLITFIITYPVIEQGISIALPRATMENLPADESRTVSIDRDGNVYFDDAPVELEALRAELKQAVDLNPDISIMVRADEEIRYKRVIGVLKLLHELRITRLALVTQPE